VSVATSCGLLAYCSLLQPHAEVGDNLRYTDGDQLPGGVCAAGDHLHQGAAENQGLAKKIWSVDAL